MNYKYLEVKVHELEEPLLEEYLDFQEKYHTMECSYFDREPEILRSREFRRKNLKVPPRKNSTSLRIIVRGDSGIVGHGIASFTTTEVNTNSDFIWFDINVLSAYQQKGIGSTLYTKLLEFAKRHGKTKIGGSLYHNSHPYTPTWLEQMGFKLKMKEKISRIYKDEINWDFIKSKAGLEEKLKKYTILQLSQEEYYVRTRDEEGFAAKMADFYTEVDNLLPMEDFELNERVITEKDMKDRADRYFSVENHWDSMTLYLLDGEKVIALSETYFPNDLPLRDIGTGFTAVRKAYQRQGIATYLKIKVLQYYTENYPSFEYIQTENASSNEGMLGINLALGFHPYFESHAYQKKLEEN